MATHPSEDRIQTPPTPDQARRLRAAVQHYESLRVKVSEARTALREGREITTLINLVDLERELAGLRDACAAHLAPPAPPQGLRCACGGLMRVIGLRGEHGVWIEETACLECRVLARAERETGGQA